MRPLPWLGSLALLVAPPGAAVSAQAVRVLELAGDAGSVSDRLGIQDRRTAAIDTFWTQRDSARLLPLARELAAFRPGGYRGWALEYLLRLELEGNRQAATTVAHAALQALRRQPLELARFVRHAMLSEPTAADYRLARMALAAVVPDHPKHAPVRVTYLAALLGAGRTKEARLTNRTIVEDLGGDPAAMLDLVHTICDAPHGKALVDTAERALAQAQAAAPTDRATLLARFRLLDGHLGRPAEAAALARRLIAGIDRAELNDWTWDLLTTRPHLGRYHHLALLAAQHLQATGPLDFHEYDTMALAHFCSGDLDRAVALQKRSLELGGHREPDYRRRLEQYRVLQRQANGRTAPPTTRKSPK